MATSTHAQDQAESQADAQPGQSGLSQQGQSPKPQQSIRNTNRWTTKQLVTMALMCAIALLLSFLEFPIIPGVAFLKLDVALVPSAVVGFAFGVGPGALVGIVCAVAHAAVTGNWVGALMNVIVACAFIVPSAAIYKCHRTLRGATVALVVATVCLIVAAIVANLVIDPVFYFMPFDTVAGYIVPAILPFNIVKGVVVSLLTALVYKSISNLITPAKDQVRGR